MSKDPFKIEIVEWKGQPTLVLNAFNKHDKEVLQECLRNFNEELHSTEIKCNCVHCNIDKIIDNPKSDSNAAN